MDIDIIHQFLSINLNGVKMFLLKIVIKANENFLCFGIFCKEEQVEFTTVITDYVAITYLGNVFILPILKGKGSSEWLMEISIHHPKQQRLRS